MNPFKHWFRQDNQPKIRRAFLFEPQPDITAYELAKLMPLMQWSGVYRTKKMLADKIDALPPECKRHIKIMEET